MSESVETNLENQPQPPPQPPQPPPKEPPSMVSLGPTAKKDENEPKENEAKICGIKKKIFFIILTVVVIVLIAVIIAIVLAVFLSNKSTGGVKADKNHGKKTTQASPPSMTDPPSSFQFLINKDDPNTFSNPDQVYAESYHFEWDVDFDRKVISGSILYNLVVLVKDVKNIIFDTRSDLKIKSVRVPAQKNQRGDEGTLDFEFGSSYLTFGKPLRVTLPAVKEVNGKFRTQIVIDFETSPEASALQWLSPEQTGEKTHPFLFSQNEAIHARSLFPCQDSPQTKATYTATVSAPKELVVLMGAVSSGVPEEMTGNPKKMVHKWTQQVPIVSYLVAIAVGKLSSKDIGSMSKVWAEPGLVAAAADDFSQAEMMVETAAKIAGKYVWGRYDILVLPPSFPYGGMEHPCLTFVSPALITGDKSLTNVVAHEIAHSWTGNLVTNKHFGHFWLNEGFTVFLERKIVGALSNTSKETRDFQSLNGLAVLTAEIKEMHEDNELTKLVVNVTDTDPDDTFSIIPYEKGSLFLYYLETLIGGPDTMNSFLKDYIQEFSYKSLDTDQWKKYFMQWLQNKGKQDSVKDVDWNAWLYQPGMPKVIPNFDKTLQEACVNLKDKWVASWQTDPFEPSSADIQQLSPGQIQGFLQLVLNSKVPLQIEKLKKMNETYKFEETKNVEILWRWVRCGLRQEVQWTAQIPKALELVTNYGRMKYIRPIYKDLYQWGGDVRKQAIDTFKKNMNHMMAVAVYSVKKDLHLDQSGYGKSTWRLANLRGSGPRALWSHGRDFL